MLTQSDEGHNEDLGALSQEHRQQHSFPGGAEDIAMHLLPARLLLGVLLWRGCRQQVRKRHHLGSIDTTG